MKYIRLFDTASDQVSFIENSNVDFKVLTANNETRVVNMTTPPPNFEEEYLTFTRVNMEEAASVMFYFDWSGSYGYVSYKTTEDINESSAGMTNEGWKVKTSGPETITLEINPNDTTTAKFFVTATSNITSIINVNNLVLSGNATKSLGENAVNVLAGLPDDLKENVVY